MGTPVNSNASELLARVMARPGTKLSEAELRTEGIDVKVLKNIFEADVRPQLRDISLRPFGDTHSDGLGELFSSSLVSGKLARHRGVPCVMVLDLQFGIPDETDTLALKLWLLRSGTWVVWLARTADTSNGLEAAGSSSEQSLYYESIDELLEFLQKNVPAGAYRLGSRDRHAGRGFPYLIIASLGNILAEEEVRRVRRLELLRKSKQSISAALDSVSFDVY